jgi:hypothetical protein
MAHVGGGEEGGIRKLGLRAGIALAILGLATGSAAAQAVGLATMQPGTLNQPTGTAIAKVVVPLLRRWATLGGIGQYGVEADGVKSI